MLEMNFGNRKSISFHTRKQNIQINKVHSDYLSILEEMSILKNDETLSKEEKRIKLKQILE